MKNTLKLRLLGRVVVVSGLALGLSLAACGDDESATSAPAGPATTSSSSTGGSGGAGGSGGMGGALPEIPALGTQVDRAGRPAITSALSNYLADDTPRGAAQDAWNADDSPADWLANFKADVRSGLALMDSLDTDLQTGVCGNQVGYDGLMMGDDYNTMATVLTNDWLIVKGDAQAGCSTYLGVEADFLGTTNDDCGGRTPVYDVGETTYSAISGLGLSGFATNVPVPQKTTTAYNAGFPYLADPN